MKKRFAKVFLDILILQMVETKPTWGYDMIKKVEVIHKFKLRHGALYPMLNKLKTRGLVKCRKVLQKRRIRKIYEITKDGKSFLDIYYSFLMDQIPKRINAENSEKIK